MRKKKVQKKIIPDPTKTNSSKAMTNGLVVISITALCFLLSVGTTARYDVAIWLTCSPA